MWRSTNAASMLLAAAIAWKSPVKWRLRSSIGTTWVRPPPAAPPLMPKIGPSEGSRRHRIGRLPIAPRPCVSETEVVVLPSPALVGVIAETHTIFASGAPDRRSITLRSMWSLCLPYRSTSSSSRPISVATSMIGRRTASWAISRLLFTFAPLLMSVRDRGRAALRHKIVLVEPGPPERLDQLGRLARADQVGDGEPDDRRGLEPVRAPSGVDDESLHLGESHDRRVVGGDVAVAGPLPQDLGVAEHRQQLDHVHRQILDEPEGARVGVARVGLDLGTHHELAAVGLADVDVQRAGHDDLVQQRLHRLGHARLQDVRGQRQRHADQVADQRAPAGDAGDHGVAADGAAVGLDPRDLAVLDVDAGDVGVLVDLDAHLVGFLAVAPDHRVVADDTAGRVVKGGQDREGGMVADVQLRAQVLDLVGVHDPRVDAHQPVHLGPLHHRVHRAVGVGQRQVPVLGEQHVEVEVLRERLVQLHARLVEAGAFGRQIVGADDGGVSARGARAQVAAVEHGDLLDAVTLGQVVGRGQAVCAGADDDDVVARLEVVVAEVAVLSEQADHAATSLRRTAAADTGVMLSIAPASSSDSHMYSPNSQPQSTQKPPSSFRMIDPQRITEPAMQAPAGNRCGRTSSEDERMNTSRTRSPPSITAAQPQVMSVAQIASDSDAMRARSCSTRENGHSTTPCDGDRRSVHTPSTWLALSSSSPALSRSTSAFGPRTSILPCWEMSAAHAVASPFDG